MEPSELTALRPRPPHEVAGLALAVQANVVQLKVAAVRRHGRDTLPEIQVPSPGVVSRYRAVLISREALADYDPVTLRLRTHEVWGQFCLLCWFFHDKDPNQPSAFAALPEDARYRCPAAVAGKTLEIEKSLWRLRFEQRLRQDPGFRHDPRFEPMYRAAMCIPVQVLGQNVQVCGHDDLLAGSCEYAGMLGVARWIGDDRWTWGQDGIMDLPEEPAL